MTKKRAKKYIKGRQIEIMCEAEICNREKWRKRLNEELDFLRYVNNVLDFIDDECDDIPPDTVFKEYKGYVLQQSGYNDHYMIFKDDKMVMHCQHGKKLDQKGAEEAIDFYLNLTEGKLAEKTKKIIEEGKV